MEMEDRACEENVVLVVAGLTAPAAIHAIEAAGGVIVAHSLLEAGLGALFDALGVPARPARLASSPGGPVPAPEGEVPPAGW